MRLAVLFLSAAAIAPSCASAPPPKPDCPTEPVIPAVPATVALVDAGSGAAQPVQKPPPAVPAAKAPMDPQPTTAMDFMAEPFTDDSTRLRALHRIAGAVVSEDETGSDRLDCGDFFAFVVDETKVKGGPAKGSVVVGTSTGRTKAVIPPRKATTYRILACADFNGDKLPELVVRSWGSYSAIFSIGTSVTTLYEGSLPFPEIDDHGKVVLHVRDARIDKLKLQMPGVLLPSTPTYWTLEGKRFAERTRSFAPLVEAQRAYALEQGARCLQDKEIFCEERIAAFFAGSASVMGDDAAVAARLPNDAVRARFRELLGALGKRGGK